MAKKAKSWIFSKDAGVCERIGAAAVFGTMSIKWRLGAGLRSKRKMVRKKRVRGFFLSASSAISAGAAAIWVIQDLVKASQALKHKQEETAKGSGLYLKPYKKIGKGIRKKKKKLFIYLFINIFNGRNALLK